MSAAWVDEASYITCHNCDTATDMRNLIDITPLGAHEHHYRCPACGHPSHWHDPISAPTPDTDE